MTARDEILANIRQKKTKIHQTTVAPDQLKPIIPAFTQRSKDQRNKLFIEKLTKASATYDIVSSIKNIPLAVENFLNDIKCDYPILLCPVLNEHNLSWKREYCSKLTTDEKKVAITNATYAVAETGTLVCLSSPKTPTSFNFLTKVNIAIVNTHDIVPCYEDAWQLINKNHGIPRTINFITGPSRTADIEQTLLLGIHGPQKLHVILINDTKTCF